MRPVNVGIVGLGNVGMGTLAILAENAGPIAEKLGFPLHVHAVCSPSVASKQLPAQLDSARRTANWREGVHDPHVPIVAQLVRRNPVARGIIQNAMTPR